MVALDLAHRGRRAHDPPQQHRQHRKLHERLAQALAPLSRRRPQRGPRTLRGRVDQAVDGELAQADRKEAARVSHPPLGVGIEPRRHRVVVERAGQNLGQRAVVRGDRRPHVPGRAGDHRGRSLRPARSDLTDLTSDVTGALAALGALQTTVTGLGLTDTALQDQIDTLSGLLATVTTSVTSLTGAVDSAEDAITTLTGDLASTTSALQTQITTLGGTLTTTNATVSSLSGTVSGLSTTVGTLTSDISTLNTTVYGVSGLVSDVSGLCGLTILGIPLGSAC